MILELGNLLFKYQESLPFESTTIMKYAADKTANAALRTWNDKTLPGYRYNGSEHEWKAFSDEATLCILLWKHACAARSTNVQQVISWKKNRIAVYEEILSSSYKSDIFSIGVTGEARQSINKEIAQLEKR